MFHDEEAYENTMLNVVYSGVMEFSNMLLSQRLRATLAGDLICPLGPHSCDLCCMSEQAIAERMGWALAQWKG